MKGDTHETAASGVAAPQASAGSAPAADLPARLQAALLLQRHACAADPVPGYRERRADLARLRRFIVENREALIEAVNRDYGSRSRHETLFAEVVPVLDGIRHAQRHVHKWMRPQRRSVDLRLFPGARNRVVPQPLGVVGLIVPWNFPINLTFSALTSIFAAGNRALVKLSENSRHLAALLIERLPRYFPTEKLAVFDETGGVGVEFSRLPLDHLLFTGSTQTGRSVMAAAAANLCPVTLELGGKSPALVCEDFPLRTAAQRILFVKLLNAGQICTTVDYLWLPRRRIAEFIEHARQIATARYPSIESADYTAIIDAPAFERLTHAIEEARVRGAQVLQLLPGKPWDAATRKIAPHLVLDPPPDCELMQREIFGPVLPVLGYEQIEEAVRFINARPRPLAFYPFSRKRARISYLLEQVMSGGVSVNDALWHVGQHDLPFGGVGASGMGHYHGVDGFLTFSKLRPVFYQAPFSGMRLLWPPFGALADRVLDFLTR
ncbi:MAG TPA: coniferyl aldehyde dehydrogenase [Steroidobacteraceae bacterium]|nr:coniferyl aldehyde dehydrogenase [Steroidobacteraceae bacterium]